MTDKSTKNLQNGSVSPTIGSIGEHIAVAHLLELFAWDKCFREIFSDIELFHIDKGTDIGIDLVVRLHVRNQQDRNDFSIMIGIQVKNYTKKRRPKRLSIEKQSLLKSFPGPLLLLLYNDYAKRVCIEDWLAFNESRRGDKLGQLSWIEVGSNPNYRKIIRDRIIEECANYVFREMSPEKHLSLYDLNAAMSTAKLLSRFKVNDCETRLLINRVMIRSARWKPAEYEKVKESIDSMISEFKLRAPHCPSYNGYCIHYQAALVRDEALRSSNWIGREYALIRTDLIRAFKALFPDCGCEHDPVTKTRLYRLGLGIISLIILLDLSQDSFSCLKEWKALVTDLEQIAGKRIEKSLIGSFYGSFISLVTRSAIPGDKVKNWYNKGLGALEARPPNRDSDEDTMVHLLCAGLWIKAKDVEAALRELDLAAAIARVQKNSLWIHPIEYVHARVEGLIGDSSE